MSTTTRENLIAEAEADLLEAETMLADAEERLSVAQHHVQLAAEHVKRMRSVVRWLSNPLPPTEIGS